MEKFGGAALRVGECKLRLGLNSSQHANLPVM
jgi:hypothetical protein